MGKLFLLLSTLVIAGCSVMSGHSQSPNAAGAERALADENFLINSGNYSRLIDLYKQQLKKNDQPETRIKLAKAYLDIQDNESALFTIAPVITQPNASAESFYLQGLAQFNLGKTQLAEHSLEVAVNKEKNNARFINLLGATQAELGRLASARDSFNRARSLLYDDVVIKNNLALVDMMEGNYQDAAARLMPVYRADPEGADDQLKANLAIIAAKLGSFETLKLLYGNQYSDTELFGIFQGLRSSNYVPSLKEQSKTDERLLGKNSTSGEIQWQKSQQVQLATGSPTVIESDQKNLDTTHVTEQVELIERQMILGQQQSESPVLPQTPLSGPLQEKKDNSGVSKMVRPRTSEQIKVEAQTATTVIPPSTQGNRQTFEDLVGIQRRYADVSSDSFEQRSSSVTNNSYDQSNEENSRLLRKDAFPSLESANEPNFNGTDSLAPVSENAPLDVQWPLPASTLKPMSHNTSIEKMSPELSLVRSERMAVKVKPANDQTTLQLDAVQSKKKWRFVPLERYSILSTDAFAIPVAQFRHEGQLIDVQ